MTGKEQNREMFKHFGLKLDYYDDYDAIHIALTQLGLKGNKNRHSPEVLEIKVKWVNTLRSIVARRCPKNKAGMPDISDVDVLLATASEQCEAIVKTIGRWKKPRLI